MNAEPLLEKIAGALTKARLETVLIGNAAAALQGAPVTTMDFGFMFRKTPLNLRKLKVLARELDAYILKPYYPLSGLYRVVNDNSGIQLEFMPDVHGIKSFASLRAEAYEMDFGGFRLKVASLDSIIKSIKSNAPK
ncbi:MAG: hypothetical protein HZA01_05125 [Nitrospinae bacterium]|nr:hypothetical protein [Nitrospinota bacterium]